MAGPLALAGLTGWFLLRNSCLAGLSSYPLFMQKHWFQPDNAGALRAHIKTIILELFLDQVSRPVSLPAAHCPSVNGSPLSSCRVLGKLSLRYSCRGLPG